MCISLEISCLLFYFIWHACLCCIQVGNSGAAGSEATTSMMQRFWDSAMSSGPLDDDDDSRRLASLFQPIIFMTWFFSVTKSLWHLSAKDQLKWHPRQQIWEDQPSFRLQAYQTLLGSRFRTNKAGCTDLTVVCSLILLSR